ncbi:hypothetical protein HZB60_01035 [candidate division KSB1 bacterium]|nr:hypothetical protein [candidate division KSB1 bacterium]
MKITLNGFLLNRVADGDTTVGQVLAELKDEIRSAGKVVSGVALDGHPLPDGWQRRQRLSRSVQSCQQLDLLITEPAALRQQTIDHTVQMIGHMRTQTKPIARKFRIGDEFTANNELATFLDDLKLVMAGLDHVTRATKEASTGAARAALNTAVGELLPTLDRIYKAQAAGDYVTIADEFEYELPSFMAGWDRILEAMAADEAAGSVH